MLGKERLKCCEINFFSAKILRRLLWNRYENNCNIFISFLHIINLSSKSYVYVLYSSVCVVRYIEVTPQVKNHRFQSSLLYTYYLFSSSSPLTHITKRCVCYYYYYYTRVQWKNLFSHSVLPTLFPRWNDAPLFFPSILPCIHTTALAICII